MDNISSNNNTNVKYQNDAIIIVCWSSMVYRFGCIPQRRVCKTDDEFKTIVEMISNMIMIILCTYISCTTRLLLKQYAKKRLFESLFPSRQTKYKISFAAHVLTHFDVLPNFNGQ